MKFREWKTKPSLCGNYWGILCVQTEDKEPKLTSFVEYIDDNGNIETTQVNATNYTIDLDNPNNIIGELVEYIIDSLRSSGETDEQIYYYLKSFDLDKPTWTVQVDYENNANKWWRSGGQRLWQDCVHGVKVSKGSVTEVLMSLPEKNRLLKRAESIVGWNDGPEHAKHPLLILSGEKEQQK